MSKKNILFVYRGVPSKDWIPIFTIEDYNFLKKKHNVELFLFKLKNCFLLPFKMKKCDLIFIWFADYYSFITTLLNKIFKKPTVIIIGGYDVACEKDMKYGLMNVPFFKKINRYVLKKSDKIIAVSNFNKEEIKKHLNIEENVEVLYNSVDVDYFKPNNLEKEKLILTVSVCSTWNRAKIKGIDIFIKTAKKLPNLKFLIIGVEKNVEKKIKKIATSNVEVLGWVSHKEIVKYYQKAKIYCQLSYYESCGVAVEEAMSCECIPVISDKGALSEVVGDTGYITKYNDIDEITDAVLKALRDKEKSKKARIRAVENFSSQKRQEKINKIITELTE